MHISRLLHLLHFDWPIKTESTRKLQKNITVKSQVGTVLPSSLEPALSLSFDLQYRLRGVKRRAGNINYMSIGSWLYKL